MLIFGKVNKYIKGGDLIICDHKLLSNFIDNFSVAKGDTDTRLVFNGTSCGLNDATWSSHFWLPLSGSMIKILSFGYAVVDIDLGEMFLNFPIHEQLHKSVGIDLTPFRQQLIHQERGQ